MGLDSSWRLDGILIYLRERNPRPICGSGRSLPHPRRPVTNGGEAAWGEGQVDGNAVGGGGREAEEERAAGHGAVGDVEGGARAEEAEGGGQDGVRGGSLCLPPVGHGNRPSL